MNNYFSFGPNHIHRIDGITLDADVILKVVDDDPGNARDRVFAAIGKTWSFQYTDETLKLKYFPRGTVEVPSI